MNRRDFLKGAGAAAIVPAALPDAIWGSGRNAAAATATSEPAASLIVPPIAAVIYDERYADCRLFADALIRQGAVAFPANGDSAQLWYGSLRAHLAQHAGRVAGLTTYADFSVSQSCGRELSLATLYEGAHDARRSSTARASPTSPVSSATRSTTSEAMCGEAATLAKGSTFRQAALNRK